MHVNEKDGWVYLFPMNEREFEILQLLEPYFHLILINRDGDLYYKYKQRDEK